MGLGRVDFDLSFIVVVGVVICYWICLLWLLVGGSALSIGIDV